MSLVSEYEVYEDLSMEAPRSVAGYSEDAVFATIEAELERAASG